jgi:hypothetical protein
VPKFPIYSLVVGGLIAWSPVLAKDSAKSNAPVRSSLSQKYTADESEALGAAAQRRAEAQQRKWDKRLNEISGSICRGC